MPKRRVQMIYINKELFLDILKKKKVSIRKLGAESPVSDRTIRRSLNNGKIKEKSALQLAAYLNVDIRNFQTAEFNKKKTLKNLRSTFKWKDIKKERPLKNKLVLVGDDDTGDVSIMLIVDGADCCEDFYEYDHIYIAILGEIDSEETDRITHWAYIKKPNAKNYRDRQEEILIKSVVHNVAKELSDE